MIKHGLQPNVADSRDYDFHKSFGNVSTPQFPSEYITDAGFGFPDQNFLGEPYGCTNFTSAEVTNDLIEKNFASPFTLEGITHANARGGYSIRESLNAARQIGWISYYFNIEPHGNLDWFDAIRLAISSGIPEKRSVSIGTPWWPIFEQVGTDGIVSTPHSLSTRGIPWHNHKIAGWKTIQGNPYLVSKSWQGPNYGDHGYVYFSRTLLNQIMEIAGTVAFTTTDDKPDNLATITLSTWDWIKSLLGFRY